MANIDYKKNIGELIKMIDNCMKCGNMEWDKIVDGERIRCPKCGEEWRFKKLPMFVLTGASGVGKTTTGQLLQRMITDVVVMDADMFYNLMPHETDNDYYAQLEQMEYFSREMMQSGKPVLWTMAGNLDKIPNTYGRRFFSSVECLALVCSAEELRSRMIKGRQITDENWIKGSIDYNQYFIEHSKIGETSFRTLDISQKSVEEVAKSVACWLKEKIAVYRIIDARTKKQDA